MRVHFGIGMGLGGLLLVIGAILWSFEARFIAAYGPGHWREGADACLILGTACLALGAYQKSRPAKDGD